MNPNGKLFVEQQRFPRYWVALSCILSLIILGVKCNELGIMHPQFQLVFCVLVTVNLILWFSRLDTVIEYDLISYRFKPFHFTNRTIKREDIEQVFVRKYHPILEYGGWGLRWSFNGKAINMKGNNGIQVVLKNGSRILIGTSQPMEASKALELFFTDSFA